MAHIEKTRAVVEAGETFDGRIVPTERAELERPVRLRDEAVVQGSVYGETVEVHADATVEGSAMAENGIELEGGHVHGEVGSPGKVVAAGGRVDGSVTGTKVTLEDCVVRGNVVGTEVILENCVVLGIVAAERALDVRESLCYTFRSRGETTLTDATLILPQAIVDGPYTLETPVAVAGLGELDLGEDENRLPEMTSDDVHEQDGTTYLTLVHRVLNIDEVTARLDSLEDAIMETVTDVSGDGATEVSVETVLSELDVDTARFGTP